MNVLVQFVLRLSFGLALAMALTSPRLVTSGYYRVHLYVLLGLNALAAALAWLRPEEFLLWPPLVAAALSYVGSVVWLYEKPAAGRAALTAVAAMSLAAAWLALPASAQDAAPLAAGVLAWLDPPAGGLVLGSTMAAMLLGHWYLNAPGMQLAPLRRLILLMAAALLLRAVLAAAGLALVLADAPWPSGLNLTFLVLRWLAGIAAALVLGAMTWQTLKIPNTQSATGILYVAVIVTFIGELSAQLLSASYPYPL